MAESHILGIVLKEAQDGSSQSLAQVEIGVQCVSKGILFLRKIQHTDAAEFKE